MSNIVNPKQQTRAAQAAATSHLNYMGGPSWFLSNPVATLKMAAASCFFGEPTYYQTSDKAASKKSDRSARHVYPTRALSAKQITHLRDTLNAIDPQDWRALTPSQVMESAIDKALDYSVEETLKAAADLRNEDHIRLTPQVILARAACHKNVAKTSLIREYAPKILQRPDDVVNCFAYAKAKFGKIPTRLKRALAAKLEGYKEYALAKYRMEGHDTNLVDVVRMVWPKFNESDPLGRLLKGQLTLSDNETWEALISAKGSNKVTWTEAVEVMGHMALLRNLRNLTQHDVDTSLYLDKLIAGVGDGKQLPFRYFSAYKALEAAGIRKPQLFDALESCMEVALAKLPSFHGRTASLCDNSGSAWTATTSTMGTMHVAEIANLMGIVTGKISEEGYIGIFGDALKMVPVKKKNGIFDQLKTANSIGQNIGHSTENGIWLFWDQAIRNKEHWDNVFVYSDQQAGHGGLYGTDSEGRRYGKTYGWGSGGYERYIDVAKLVAEYRKTVNPNVNVYLVQVAGYQDTIMPEFYDRTYILGGWSEGLLQFAHKMSNPGPKQ